MTVAIASEFLPDWSGSDRHRVDFDDGLLLEIITVPWLHLVFYTEDESVDLYETVDDSTSPAASRA